MACAAVAFKSRFHCGSVSISLSGEHRNSHSSSSSRFANTSQKFPFFGRSIVPEERGCSRNNRSNRTVRFAAQVCQEEYVQGSRLTVYRYIEQHPDLLGKQEHLSIVGHGIGAVPAAALACADSITDLLCTSHELTLLSVRLGLAAVIRACTVDSSKNEHPWALRLKDTDSTTLSDIFQGSSSKTVCYH